MPINRRSLLTAAAAAPLASMLPTLAKANAPRASTQVPGLYRNKVGTVEVTALLDGYIDIAKEVLLPFDQKAHGDQLDLFGQDPNAAHYRTAINSFLINTGSKLILLDAGTPEGFLPNAGKIKQSLAAAGVTPDQIDMVLMTHLHGDHFGALATATGEAYFVNAELCIAQAEWDFWYSDAVYAATPADAKFHFDWARKMTAPYTDRVKFFTGETDLGSGITAIPMPGHTPGHTGYLINSGTDSLLIAGDIIHTPGIQFSHPEITIAFDTDAALAAETRKRVLDMASADQMRLCGMHFDFPGFGKVTKDGSGFRYQAAPWLYDL